VHNRLALFCRSKLATRRTAEGFLKAASVRRRQARCADGPPGAPTQRACSRYCFWSRAAARNNRMLRGPERPAQRGDPVSQAPGQRPFQTTLPLVGPTGSCYEFLALRAPSQSAARRRGLHHAAAARAFSGCTEMRDRHRPPTTAQVGRSCSSSVGSSSVAALGPGASAGTRLQPSAWWLCCSHS
jgi:hypothetical protein